jgi:hypothetical protein
MKEMGDKLIGADTADDLETATGTHHPDAAWSYPSPNTAAIGLVGGDFSDYIAFDRTVTAIRERDEATGWRSPVDAARRT